MNERIQELAQQAGGGPSKWYTNPDVLEYFAELIVRECAHIGFNAAYPDKGVAVLTAIKEHFGVEG